MGIVRRSGQVTFLRAHRLGGKYGPPDDQIDVEFVGRVDSSDHTFGNTLRPGEELPSHEAMFQLLRDGIVHRETLETTVDYDIDTDERTSGIVIRVELRPS